MKELVKRPVSLALAVFLCVGITLIPVSARSSAYLSAYRAWLSTGDDGEIKVVVDVQATDYMDVGANKIELFESSDGGDTWDPVRIFLSPLYPGMIKENVFLYYDIAARYDGTVGCKYKAIVTVYAGDDTGSDTREYTTKSVTAVARAS